MQRAGPNNFSGVVGQRVTPIRTSATATYDDPTRPCMLALGEKEPTRIDLVGSAKINAPNCSVQSNAKGTHSIDLQGAPKVTAKKVCAAGGTSGRTKPPAEKCDVATDPLADRDLNWKTVKSDGEARDKSSSSSSQQSNGTASYASTYTGPCTDTNRTISAGTQGPVVLRPGVYCGGLSIQSVEVILEAGGIYQIQDGPLSLQGNASLTGTNVAILLSGVGAVLDLQGSPTLTLTAMTTGPFASVAIASDTPSSPILTSTMQGSPDINVTGSIYLPNQRLKMQGSPALNMLGSSDALVALSFELQGSPDINIKSNLSGNGAGQIVRLIR